MKYKVPLKVLIIILLVNNIGCEFNKKNESELLEDDVNVSDGSFDLLEKEKSVVYDQEQFTFHGSETLNEDLYINARNVNFKSNSRLKLSKYNLTVEAETVVFHEGSSLVGYDSDDFNSCRKHGNNSGSVSVDAVSVTGSTYVELVGQNAGLASGIYHPRNGLKYQTSDREVRGGRYINKGCYILSKGYNRDEWIAKNPPKNGGKAGKLNLIFENNDLSVETSNRRSLGSFKGRLEGRSGTLSWWSDIHPVAGKDGDTPIVCFYVFDEYLCNEDGRI